jgi:flavin reductase (DIM6/NTAB) family NADH-FMN oxidoreductase RutF
VTGTAFDKLMARVDAPLAVVTTAANGERAGCLVGFQCQCGIDPPRYAIWLSKANHTYRVGLHASHYAVHFLTVADRRLAELFGSRTGDEVDKFAGLEVVEGPGDVPVLADAKFRLVLRRQMMMDDGGDHVCITGDVVAAECPGEFRPLRLDEAADLPPGHEADDFDQE